MARKSPVVDRSAGLFERTETPQQLRATEEIVEAPVPRTKRTFYIPDQQLIALAHLQAREYGKTGKKPDLSGLVGEALTLLFEKYDIEVS